MASEANLLSLMIPEDMPEDDRAILLMGLSSLDADKIVSILSDALEIRTLLDSGDRDQALDRLAEYRTTAADLGLVDLFDEMFGDL